MTARELELAQRHLDLLRSMKDEAWQKVLYAERGNTVDSMRHNALDHAVKLAEAYVDQGRA